jgi:hypothetical protein
MVENGREFRDAIAPWVAGIRAFAVAVDAVVERQYPDPESIAMKEIAAEKDYLGVSAWQNPVADAHMFGGMTLRAANDYLRAFAQAFDTDAPPVYAQAAIARGAFEAASVSAWLSDPEIDAVERLKRALCERVYSAAEVKKLTTGANSSDRLSEWTADSTAALDTLITIAATFGWSAKRDETRAWTVDGTRRPRVSDSIRWAAGSDDDSPIGDMLYVRTSAVLHSTWFGLQSGLDIQGAKPGLSPGFGTVSFGTSIRAVGGVAHYVLRSVRAAATTRADFMGLADAAWQAALGAVKQLELGVAQTVLGADSD